MELDTVICGNCLDILPGIPDASIDAVITDPPYPHIKRDYGTWTEAEWWAMVVEGVVPEVRRILKPTGSAVFILQPNSRKVGSMRGWLWEFMAWVCREWNMVQDVWWWNYNPMPEAKAIQGKLMRPSIKACVWSGVPKCYRLQDNVMIIPAKSLAYLHRWRKGHEDKKYPSGHHVAPNILEKTLNRKGATPQNILPVSSGNCGLSRNVTGSYGHGAGTPLALADWWTRYIVPPGGTVLDPFFGVGTMGVAAIKNRCHFIGIEKEAHYCETAEKRIDKAQEETAQMEMPL